MKNFTRGTRVYHIVLNISGTVMYCETDSLFVVWDRTEVLFGNIKVEPVEYCDVVILPIARVVYCDRGVYQIECNGHSVQFGGGDGDGYCYGHQSFDCVLSPQEQFAIRNA